MMKTAAIIFCVLALIFFAECQPSRRLLVYTPHGQDMLRDFVARYKQVNPEVEVQFLDMADERRLPRIINQACYCIIRVYPRASAAKNS